jgi:signal transduction histidine kinase
VTRVVSVPVATFTRLPIRWRLALTSFGLTLLILTAFALVIGVFTTRQVRDHFDDDLRATIGDLQGRVRVQGVGANARLIGADAIQAAAAGDAVLRVLNSQGHVLVEKRGTPNLGSPLLGPHNEGNYRVISRPIFAQSSPDPVAFVQYAKPRDSVNGTLDRIHLFLAGGVLGGALFALLAGLAVARRAMAPVQQLTRAAQEIARTRDTAVTLPKPESEDEVSELSHTLDDMLRELDAARTELETLLTRQREFVADASHELRTPLTSILANLELLEAALEGEDAEVVQSALRSSRRMRGLVSDLLLLARADAQRERAREPVDVSEVIRAAAGEAAPLAAGHDLAVEVNGRVIVDGWRDDLHRLVLNLMENSLRHTPPGTPVRAGALTTIGGDVEIYVEDEGPGLPDDIRGRAFDRFVRGGGDVSRTFAGGSGGSGLGLAIVNAVATSHGGYVAYEDRPAGGARFVVRIPAAAPATPPPRPAESSAGA